MEYSNEFKQRISGAQKPKWHFNSQMVEESLELVPNIRLIEKIVDEIRGCKIFFNWVLCCFQCLHCGKAWFHDCSEEFVRHVFKKHDLLFAGLDSKNLIRLRIDLLDEPLQKRQSQGRDFKTAQAIDPRPSHFSL